MKKILVLLTIVLFVTSCSNSTVKPSKSDSTKLDSVKVDTLKK